MNADEYCKDCKWLEDNDTWCDMLRSGRCVDDLRCSHWDDSVRRFEPKVFYNLCKDYVKMFESFESKKDYNFYSRVEFLGFVLNDIKREVKYYQRFNLEEDLCQVDLPITQRK